MEYWILLGRKAYFNPRYFIGRHQDYGCLLSAASC
jgi:hypothetical protein